MKSINTINNKNNKTINLSRAIMILVKNAEYNVDHNKEKTLLTKIETACYNLIDTNHNNNSKIKNDLDYILDLMIMARQVNLFLEENTVFIISVISEISKSLETKLEVSNEEIVNEKIRDILQGGEMSETQNIDTKINLLSADNGQKDIQKEIKNYESAHAEIKKIGDRKTSETKLINNKFLDKSVINNENKKTEKLDAVENKFLRDSNHKNINIENNRKLSRREEVLKVLSKNPVSIKDVSDKVLGCSEKTLQRELNTLVDLKLAERIGEKRWSRYVLA